MIGTLGYNEQAAGIARHPRLAVPVCCSPRDSGSSPARYGPRLFMSARPGDHGARPAVARADPGRQRRPGCWAAGRRRRSCRPADYFTDLLPALLVFGIGLSDHGRAAHDRADDLGAREELGRGLGDQQRHLPGGLAARERRDLRGRRVQLLRARSASRCPAVERDSRAFRAEVAPLNQPSADVSPEVRAAARTASTDAFHLADAGLGRTAAGRRRRQRRRDPQPFGRGAPRWPGWGSATARCGGGGRPCPRLLRRFRRRVGVGTNAHAARLGKPNRPPHSRDRDAGSGVLSRHDLVDLDRAADAFEADLIDHRPSTKLSTATMVRSVTRICRAAALSARRDARFTWLPSTV